MKWEKKAKINSRNILDINFKSHFKKLPPHHVFKGREKEKLEDGAWCFFVTKRSGEVVFFEAAFLN